MEARACFHVEFTGEDDLSDAVLLRKADTELFCLHVNLTVCSLMSRGVVQDIGCTIAAHTARPCRPRGVHNARTRSTPLLSPATIHIVAPGRKSQAGFVYSPQSRRRSLPGDRFIELAMSEERHVLDVLFRYATEAVTVQDRTGRLVYANDRAALLVGLSSGQDVVKTPAEDLASRFEVVDEYGVPLPLESLAGSRVLAGEAVAEQTVGYRLRDSESVRWSSLRSSPIRNDAGEVVWVINHFLDITDEMRRREGEKVLARVNEVVGESLGLEETLRGLVDVVVPGIAQWGQIHLVEHDVELVLVVAAAVGSGESDSTVGMSESERMPLDSNRIQARVTATGRPVTITDITDITDITEAVMVAGGRATEDLPEGLNIGSVLCLPLMVGRSAVGTLTVGRTVGHRDFDDADLTTLTSVAERAAIALANARIHSQDHETAEALRSGLVPRRFPEVAGLRFAARYQPFAQVGHLGGDFYDVIEVPEGAVALVGDIEGKGIPAAAAVGLARHTLRATIQLTTQAQVVVDQLNLAMLNEEPQRMCTLAYLNLSRRCGSFQLETALAGHPPPFLIRADGSVETLGAAGLPTGLFPLVPAVSSSTELRPGDTVLAYTDGFSFRDSTPPESLRPMLVGAAVESLDGLLDRLLASLEAAGGSSRDDIALLAIRCD